MIFFNVVLIFVIEVVLGYVSVEILFVVWVVFLVKVMCILFEFVVVILLLCGIVKYSVLDVGLFVKKCV